MCLLCTELWTEQHWAEIAAEETDTSSGAGDVVALEVQADRRGRRLRERAERARLVGVVLAAHRLQVQDWEGDSYILRDAKGNSAVVPDLAAVWREAERMLGAPLDPLDPDFLDALPGRPDGGTA